jgi:DNA-binding Lrp family transcriptional regulator
MRSNNEDAVLLAIVENPLVSDSTIAKKLGLSSAGVGKIRRKIERNGLIEGYEARVNYGEVGLHTFAIIHVKVTNVGWKYRGRLGVQDLLVANQNIVRAYRIPGRDVTHILCCAFRNLTELDKFIKVIQAQLSDYIEVVQTYVFSSEGILKDRPKDLLLKLISEGDEWRMPEPLLFGEITGD